MNRSSLVAAVLGLILAGGACQTPSTLTQDKQHTVQYQDEAAEFTLSALPEAIPWEEALSDKLQPNFQMSGRDALNQVIPTTLKIEEALFDLVRAKLRVALPTSGFSESRTTSGAGEAVTNSFSRTEDKKSGDISKAPNPDSLDNSDLPSSNFSDAVKAAPAVVDPILRHQAAVALNQEVQILNAYLKHIEPRGYKAYVIRLQVGVTPYARNQPYDAYATFGFFKRGKGTGETMPASVVTEAPADKKATDKKALPEGEAKLGSARDPKPPIVVPLLVSDNLEAALHARTIEQVRQFALGLAAMLQGVGIEGEFERLVRRLESVFGSDINSLLTVGKTAPNVLRVRFGAMNQPDSRYAMVPRNNFVTALMLVETNDVAAYGADGIQIGMIGELRHATTGKTLPLRSSGVLYPPKILDINKTFHTRFTDRDLFTLLAFAEQNEVASFRNFAITAKIQQTLGRKITEAWIKQVDARTREGNWAEAERALGDVRAHAKGEPAEARKNLNDLQTYVQSKNRLAVSNLVSACTSIQAEPLWIYISNLRLGSPNRIALFHLPVQKEPGLALAAGNVATLLLLEKSAELTLRGHTNSSLFQELGGSLLYTKNGQNHAFPAKQLSSIEDGAGIRAVFPKLNEALAGFSADTLKFRLEGKMVKGGPRDYAVAPPILVATVPEEKNYAYKARVSTSTLLSTPGGEGTCDVYIESTDPAAPNVADFLKVEGASIQKASIGAADQNLTNPKGIAINSSTVVTLKLYNLLDRSTVTFSGEKIDKTTVQVLKIEPAKKD